jgi:hypothetical protein
LAAKKLESHNGPSNFQEEIETSSTTNWVTFRASDIAVPDRANSEQHRGSLKMKWRET